MPSTEAQAMIRQLVELSLPLDAPGRDHAELRALTDGFAAAQAPVSGVVIDRLDLGGIDTERTRPEGLPARTPVLYFHGGGYVCGSAGGQREYLAQLSRGAAAEIWCIEYRLAPEHPFPAAIDDGVAAYLALLERRGGERFPIGGDAGGGGLMLAVLVALRDLGAPLPTAAFAISPWADLTLRRAIPAARAARDFVVRFNDLVTMRDEYLAGADPATPTASPILADLTGLPTVVLFAGGEEILLADAELFVRQAIEAGVDARLVVAPGMFHAWPIFGPHLPESQPVIDAICELLG